MKSLPDSQGDAAPVVTPARHGLGSTFVLALGTFAVGTDAFIMSAFLPAMADDLSVTPAMASQSVTAFALAYALLAPVVTSLTAIMPRRKLLVLALIFLGLANIGSALAPTLGILIAIRIAAAAAAAAYTPSAGAVAAAIVHPHLRARALAVIIGGLATATALGVPLGRIASTALNWRASLALVGIVSFIAALGVLAAMPKLPGNVPVTLRQRLAVLARPGVMIVLPLTVIGMAACYLPYAFTVQVLDSLLIPSTSIMLMLLCYGFGAVVGSCASGWATDRLGPNAVLITVYSLMAGTLGGLARLSDVPSASMYTGVAVLMACWGASSWSQTPAQQHRLIASAPQDAALAVAFNSSGIYLGISIGTAIGSHAIGIGTSTALWYGCALALAALFYMLVTTALRSTTSGSAEDTHKPMQP
ncbi:MFS transporter [Mesorhizobium sp. M00.F.Ca.ET.216.01.1.1]|uniref:MFS transporter n=1 Tax=Mesorhizobium sp. M00.F.Ca.ET.216.01.1.1 TaxID=2500528 RepID=UPI001AED6E5A|nr:MFS transporter [Mesorhizobium sp. M00.F.Ca.ET.216.01.1.1]